MYIDFGSLLVPTCLHFSIKNPPKSHIKSISRCVENLVDFRPHFPLFFGSILGHNLGPCWPLVRHKTPSRPSKKASKISPNAQNGPNAILTPPDLHVAPPGLDVGVPGCPFGSPRPRCCPRRLIFKRFKVVPLLHYYIVIFGFQTSILGDF